MVWRGIHDRQRPLAVRFGELGAGRLSSSLRMRGWEIGTWRLKPQGTITANDSSPFLLNSILTLFASLYRRRMTWRPEARIGHRKRKERGWTTDYPEKSTWQCEEINVATTSCLRCPTPRFLLGSCHSLSCCPMRTKISKNFFSLSSDLYISRLIFLNLCNHCLLNVYR